MSSNPADAGFFAVLDLPTARRFALPIAKLTAGEGKPVVTLSAESVEAGYKTMTTTRDGFHVGGGSADPAAWPLTKVDHALVPTDVDEHRSRTPREHRPPLAVRGGTRPAPPPDGFVPMPAAPRGTDHADRSRARAAPDHDDHDAGNRRSSSVIRSGQPGRAHRSGTRVGFVRSVGPPAPCPRPMR